MTEFSAIPLQNRPELVRRELADQKLDGFIITRGDHYLGEYVAPCAERLAWLTGFTGSAGLAVLLQDEGCVFSDGRYAAQLEEQVPHHLWERQHMINRPLRDWLCDHAAIHMGRTGKRLKIGYDPHLVSQNQLESWRAEHGPELVAVASNPIDRAWTDRPVPPCGKIMVHPLELAGETSQSKRERLAEELRRNGQKATILADCTSIMWLLNLRGSDVPMTPVAHGYAILFDDGRADFFADLSRFDARAEDGVQYLPPETLDACLKQFSGSTVRIDPATTPVWFADTLKKHGARIIDAPDLCSLPKAVKNETEQKGSHHAHALDGLALLRFLHWLEENAIGKSETELAEKLEEFRTASSEYRGPSFDTISASGPNGAWPHYRAEKGRDRRIEKNSVYLVDSGGQYPFGTTDITRTIWIGPDAPDAALKEVYTCVLRGNIALSLARFPDRTPGYRLDGLARAPLWEAGLDYDHGTGHGIGSYLSVHEGPQSISSAPRPVGLQEGMIVSNEPGYYHVGAYGIRIENLLLVKKAEIAAETGREFLEFGVLSFTPIDRKLIEADLLGARERNWLNAYHAEVERRFLPKLGKDEPALRDWLKAACAPL